MFLAQCLLTFIFELVCLYHCLRRCLMTFCLSFFSHRMIIFHTLQHVLGFSNLLNLNVVFFILTILLCLSFLKKLLCQLVLSVFNEHQFVIWGGGGSVLLKSCLPSVPTSTFSGSCCKAILSVSEFYSF